MCVRLFIDAEYSWFRWCKVQSQFWQHPCAETCKKISRQIFWIKAWQRWLQQNRETLFLSTCETGALKLIDLWLSDPPPSRAFKALSSPRIELALISEKKLWPATFPVPSWRIPCSQIKAKMLTWTDRKHLRCKHIHSEKAEEEADILLLFSSRPTARFYDDMRQH